MKKFLLGLIIICLFAITGCGNKQEISNNGKECNINGVSVKLNKEDNRDGIKYMISSSFERDYKASTSTYTIYKDKNGDKYDLSNIVFRLDVNVDEMNLESKIEKEKELIKRKDNFEDVIQEQKLINGTTWEYSSFYNTYDANNRFKEHVYVTEKKVNQYYYLYKVYFSYAEDIAEFEEAFMNNVRFN